MAITEHYRKWRESELAKRAVPRSCRWCGSPFFCFPKYIKRGKGEFCSRSCSASYRWQGGKKVKSTCPKCGSEFEMLASKPRVFCSNSCLRVDRSCGACGRECLPQRRYCSRICRDAKRPPRMIKQVNCVACHKPFMERICVLKKGQGRYCSKQCFASDVINLPHMKGLPYAVGKGGKRDDLGSQYFRSRWEANYARYLNWMKDRGEIKRWEYEPHTFEFPVKKGSKFYTPDFFIVWPDDRFEYHEVKGYMDQKSKTKLDRMKRHHPSIKIVMVEKSTYKQLHNAFSRLIPGWESPSGSHQY